MKRFFLALIFLALVTKLVLAGSLTLLDAGKPPSGGATPFALDGSSQTGNGSGASVSTSSGLTTSFSNDIVCAAVITNAASVSNVTSSHLTFSRPSGITGTAGSGGTKLDLWCAVASGTLSSETITATPASSAFTTILAFAVSGAKTSSTFEGAQEQNATGVTCSITTSSANTMGFGVDIDNTSTPATGFTDMNATARGNFLQLDYKFATSAFSAQLFSSNASQPGSICIAIVQGP